MQKEKKMIDPRVKDILKLLGAGVFLTASVLVPGLSSLTRPIIQAKKDREADEWKKYNQWRLKQVLKRLYKQKMVEIVEENGTQIVKISENGRRKLLRYSLNTIELDNKKWDGKWRIITYDIYSKKTTERYLFQAMLKKLKFYQLQKSVYLTPFSCHNEIEYLRQVCEVGSEVFILTISGLENESAYKEYFNL